MFRGMQLEKIRMIKAIKEFVLVEYNWNYEDVWGTSYICLIRS
jgi:hypothetical protein